MAESRLICTRHVRCCTIEKEEEEPAKSRQPTEAAQRQQQPIYCPGKQSQRTKVGDGPSLSPHAVLSGLMALILDL